MADEDEQIRVWDKWGTEQAIEDTDCLETWDLCRQQKKFPNGLIEFLNSAAGCNFPAPSPIQSYAWPALLSGMDVIGIAKTGSGKTLAFLLPAFMWLKKDKKKPNPVDLSVGPAVLCLTPTRELCFQIYSDAAKFGEPVAITAACCFGGQNKREQEWEIKKGPHCLIATPGRLNDFGNTGVVRFDNCKFCILDEADRMLDMGFEPQLKQILDRCPQSGDANNGDRQTSMFTATWNKEVRVIADKYIHNPVMVQIGTDQITSNKNITQHIQACNAKEDKKAALDTILDNLDPEGSCLVFCNTKRQCRDLCWDFANGPLKAVELHGDLDQGKRDESLNQFRNGEARILIATDLAARGLDIRSCTVVVNWDVPKTAEDYIHRIGRTGRAGDKGDAYTFFNPWGEQKQAGEIKDLMEKAGQEVPECLEELANGRTPSSGGGGGGGGGGGASWDKKDDKWGGASSWDAKAEGQDSGEEMRVHPSDKQKTPYSFAGFVDFAGDESKAKRMWAESKPVAGSGGGKRKADNYDAPAAKHQKVEEDTFETGMEVDKILVEQRGTELSIAQLKSWLDEQGLETTGGKKALVDRAHQAAMDMV